MLHFLVNKQVLVLMGTHRYIEHIEGWFSINYVFHAPKCSPIKSVNYFYVLVKHAGNY